MSFLKQRKRKKRKYKPLFKFIWVYNKRGGQIHRKRRKRSRRIKQKLHGKNTGNMERNYYKKITKDWETDVAVIWKNSILTILLIWISYFLSTIFFMLINVILFIYSLQNKKDLLIDYYFLKLMKLFEWHKQAFSLLNKAKTFYYSGRLH